jgi:predicted dehydrogenase
MSTTPVRVIQVGLGSITRAWLKAIQDLPEIDLVGLVDLNRDAALARAQEFGLDPGIVFDSLPDAVAATSAEAVFDTTVPSAHHVVTLEALQLGCHVLGEKPMSDSLDRARQMVAAAEQADRWYAVTQTRRPTPMTMALQQALVRDAILEDIQAVHADFFIGAYWDPDNFRRTMPDVLLLDMAIHTFDQARQLSGADPKRVYCRSWNPRRSWYAGDSAAIAIFDMVDAQGREQIFTYRGSWTDEGHQTPWEAWWRITGHAGTLFWDGRNPADAHRVKDPGSTEFQREMDTTTVHPVGLERHGHAYLIHDFAQSVIAHRTGDKRPPMCPAADNIKSLAMVLAATESSRTGQPVDISV